MTQEVSHTEVTGRSALGLSARERPVLKRLMEPNGRVFTAWVALHLTVWGIAGCLVVVGAPTGWRILLTLIIANQLHALTVLQHECGHGSAYRSRRLNLWVGRFLAWLIFMPFSTFTEMHRFHHAYLGDPGKDPDEWFYAGGPGQVFIRECLFLPYFVARSLTQDLPKASKQRIVRELAFNVLSWAAILTWGVQSGHLTEMIYVLLAPMLILACVINPISRGYEHYPMAGIAREAPERRDLRQNTVTVTSPMLGFLWANITYHVEHHLYPRVPFYRLPLLHRMLRDRQYTVEPYPLHSIFTKQNT